VTDSGPKEFDINTQPSNDDTENKRDESSSENVNSDMETQIIGPYSSFTESILKEPINKIIAIVRAKTKALPKNRDDKIEQAHDINANNIIKIRDSLLARRDNILIFLTQDGEPRDDGSHMLAKDNKVNNRCDS